MKIQRKTNEITIFESVLYKTTTTVIQLENNVIVVDPNWLPNEVHFIYDYIQSIVNDRQLVLLYTHSDYDHIIGAGLFQNCKIIASNEFVHGRDKDLILKQIKDFDAQYYMERDYPIIYPTVDLEIKEDNQVIQLNGDNFQFYLAPGHTKDGLIIYIESLKLLIVGDYLSDVEFPFIEDLSSYESTLVKLRKILTEKEVEMLVVGHGNSTGDLKQMYQRIDESEKYIQSLKDNEDIIEYLSKKYLFFEGMKEIHATNQQLIKKPPY